MEVALIAACGTNGVIGKAGGLPWRLPADLRHFRRLTYGKPVLMGRRTFASIGRVLPGRLNIVLTRQQDYPLPEGCLRAASLAQALEQARQHGAQEAMVIGGAQLSAQALPLATTLYLTRVAAAPEGDTFFPSFAAQQWRQVSCQAHPADAQHAHAYTFLTYKRYGSKLAR